MKTLDLTFIDKLRARPKSLPHSEEITPAAVAPERTICCLDKSSSMRGLDYPPTRFMAAVSAFEEFVKKRTEISPADLISVILFNEQAEVAIEDAQISTLPVNLGRIKNTTPESGTSIATGLHEASKILSETLSGYQSRILLLTDGYGGDHTLIAETLKESGVIIDVVGIAGDRSDVNEESLRKTASVVDGKLLYRFIGDGDSNELGRHFESMATELVKVR